MKELTPIQQNVLSLLRRFHAQEDRMPATREIQKILGIKHQNTVCGVQQALVKKGFLEKRQSGRRGWFRFARVT